MISSRVQSPKPALIYAGLGYADMAHFRSAEELWEEAALFDSNLVYDTDELEAAIEAVGDVVEMRLVVLIRRLGWVFIDHELLSRQVMKTSIDRWFASRGVPEDERPVRPGLRNKWYALALQPLRDSLEDHQVDGLIEALGFVVGTEAVITLLDALHLSPEAAKERQLTTALWILRGGLAEIEGAGNSRRRGSHGHAP